MRQASRSWIGAFLFALILSHSHASAESERSLFGIIVDRSSGLPIERAFVRIAELGRCAESDASGAFSFVALPFGTWKLNVSRVGYSTVSLASVEIVEGFERQIRIELSPIPIILPAQTSNAEREEDARTHRIDVASARSSARTLPELLATVPGVRVYGSAETPGGTRISVGGEPATRVAVLLDGMPLSGGPDGAVNLDAIPLGAVSAIEVTPGGQAVIAGDAAVGGVVNLLTPRRDHAAAVTGAAGSGAWGSYRQEFRADMSRAPIPFDAGIERSGRGNEYRFRYAGDESSGTRHNAGIDNWRAFGRLANDASTRVDFLAYGSRSQNGAPGTLESPKLEAFTRTKNARVQSTIRLLQSARTEAEVGGWYEFTSEYYNAARERLPAKSYLREHYAGVKADFSTGEFGLDTRFSGETRFRSLLGKDYQRPPSSLGLHERREYALRSSVARVFRTPLGMVSSTLGLSLDADDDNAPAYSPRLDLTVHPNRDLAFSGGWGRSFRRPLLTSMFWKADYYTQGNPALHPERAREWDVAARWSSGWLTAESRYFERAVTDIIVWDLRGVPQRYEPVNLSRANVIGREDHLRLQDPNEGIILEYAHVFNDATDDSGEPNTDGRTLVFTPRHTHDLSLAVEQGRFWGRVSGRWVSLRYTKRANTKSRPPYRVFDIESRVTILSRSPQLSLSFRGENLTNEPIELLEGYPSPSRTITVGLSAGI
jgi:outer membrane receptor protein involved in Fe transport